MSATVTVITQRNILPTTKHNRLDYGLELLLVILDGLPLSSELLHSLVYHSSLGQRLHKQQQHILVVLPLGGEFI